MSENELRKGFTAALHYQIIHLWCAIPERNSCGSEIKPRAGWPRPGERVEHSVTRQGQFLTEELRHDRHYGTALLSL